MSKRLNTNIPELRFPEFKGNWQGLALSGLVEDIIDYRGKAPPKSESGIILITARNVKQGFLDFTSKEFIPNEDYDAWMSRGLPQKGDILFTTEAPLGNICMFPDSGIYALGQRTLTLRAKNSLSCGKFLFYILQSPKIIEEISNKSTGSTAKGIKSSLFKKILLKVASVEEQEKIASFLGSIDTRLTQLRRKHELLQTYKRGVMQKLFSQEVRFKDAIGFEFPDWQKKNLGYLASRQVKKNIDESITRVLTNSAVRGVVDQQDYFDKDIANANNLAGYYTIEKGDYVYNPRISVSAPVGPIHKNKIGLGVMSPLYMVFRFNSKENAFYEQYFKTYFWHKYMCSIANYGARHDRMNISTSDFMALPLPYPVSEEQEKIANFLISIDQKIEAVDRQIDRTGRFKKGLLQKMFV